MFVSISFHCFLNVDDDDEMKKTEMLINIQDKDVQFEEMQAVKNKKKYHR